ncbi:DUF2007 domain-containing protein [Halomonas sp. RT37]|uniref:DUF2007 domain-containing protein n=1 Tax=Halomonas sp. RT37 TaxID=2950872 RepID=A0AAU7KG99_9GAMM
MTEVPWTLIFSHGNALLVGHVRNLLDAAGIPCELRNMTLGGGAGELPPLECEPQVWVAEHNRERAEALVKQALEEPAPDSAWRCRACGEELEGALDTCWNCGGRKEDDHDR